LDDDITLTVTGFLGDLDGIDAPRLENVRHSTAVRTELIDDRGSCHAPRWIGGGKGGHLGGGAIVSSNGGWKVGGEQ